jgi:hypothetical protein
MTAAAMVMLVGGCRTATRVVEEPRVDLEVPAGGNRGFLVGTPPAAVGGRKTTRQMVETEIEVPPIVKTGPPSEAGTPAAEPAGETSGSSQETSSYAK